MLASRLSADATAQDGLHALVSSRTRPLTLSTTSDRPRARARAAMKVSPPERVAVARALPV